MSSPGQIACDRIVQTQRLALAVGQECGVDLDVHAWVHSPRQASAQFVRHAQASDARPG
jgi:hypothetical protein